jgi:energy-coupling factor transport system permease protein
MAMEARCYNGGDGRTKMKPLHYESRDRIAYAVVLGFLALVIVAAIFVPFPM